MLSVPPRSRSPRVLRSWMGCAASARLHLVLCPFGGASLGAFRSWRSLSESSGLNVSWVSYPGRDERSNEVGIQSVQHAARELAGALVFDPPRGRWLLVGHSLGAQIAFETCSLLEHEGRGPSGLVLSGCHGPHLSPCRLLAQLPEEEFVEALIALGSCPDQLRTNREFRSVYLPLLRADFAASESYHRARESLPRLKTAALLLYGESDREAPRAQIEAWRDWFVSRVCLEELPGGHFYITEQPEAFLAAIHRHFPIPRSVPSDSDTYFP